MNIDAGDIAFVRVLGPIQVVTTSGRALDLPSASQRRLLARLAVDAPRALRVDLLCDVLAVSPGALRTIVSRLRKGFGGTTVVASQGRYRLAAPVDAALFTASLSRRGAGEDRIGTLEQSLALWTGPAFEEFSVEAWAEPEAARLSELYHAAGPSPDGWTVVVVYDSKANWENFRDSVLMPSMQRGITGGFTAPPEETGFEIVTEVNA